MEVTNHLKMYSIGSMYGIFYLHFVDIHGFHPMDPSWVSPIILPETNSSVPENRQLDKRRFLLESTIFRGELLVFTPRTINILHLKMMGTVVFLTPDLVFLTPPCFFDP